jgi:cyclase
VSIRLIARLDIKGPNLVKGIRLEGLRVLGRPERFASAYYEQGADELLYMDVVASLYGRNSLLDMVRKTAQAIFIPLTVGGGLRSIDDIREALRAGADKVSINTAAVHNPELIREASRRFGSSTIVVSIEAIRSRAGTYEAYVDNGRQQTGLDAIEWATRAAEMGAGELLVTSIDREGTGGGFDLDLTRRIADAVPIPVIACGGAGTVAHVAEAVTEGRADAVAVASLVHYELLGRRSATDDFAGEGNVEFLKRRAGFSKVRPASLPEVRAHLASRHIPCRTPSGDALDHV